ncbi:MAG: GNAT family N-acetyltransferase [Bacteroidetes bacterium]|jgi:ribosomal-protein-alanine N-acetyltransferase|nr:GNAT family N-acetyltransferase [Bacteroidota bacterium]
MRNNGRINEFIPRPNMQTLQQAEELIDKVNDNNNNKQVIAWAVFNRENELIGTCGFNSIEVQNSRAEIGSEMDIRFWGRRYAVEAVAAIVNYGLNEMQLHTIEAKVSPDNKSAIYLLEHPGFVKEAHYKDRGYFDNRFWDLAVYTNFGA